MAAGPSATKTRAQRRSSADYIAERVALAAKFGEFEEGLDDGERAALIALHDGYSEGNALRIAMQDPEATDVRGYTAWQEVGRQVRKGETGIRILAPAGNAKKAEGGDVKVNVAEIRVEPAAGGEQAKPSMRMRLVSVFDIRQTDEMTAEEALAIARRRAGAA